MREVGTAIGHDHGQLFLHAGGHAVVTKVRVDQIAMIRFDSTPHPSDAFNEFPLGSPDVEETHIDVQAEFAKRFDLAGHKCTQSRLVGPGIDAGYGEDV